MQQGARETGADRLTLEDVNAEIDAVRALGMDESRRRYQRAGLRGSVAVRNAGHDRSLTVAGRRPVLSSQGFIDSARGRGERVAPTEEEGAR